MVTWQEQGVCASVDTELFFPRDDNSQASHHAKRICVTCPVVEYCRIQGIGERWGVFGGMSVTERRALRTRMGVVIDRESTVNPWLRVADRAWLIKDPKRAVSEALGKGLGRVA